MAPCLSAAADELALALNWRESILFRARPSLIVWSREQILRLVMSRVLYAFDLEFTEDCPKGLDAISVHIGGFLKLWHSYVGFTPRDPDARYT